MSYTKYTWETGEVITAAKLNHIEDGIAAIGSGQYTIEAPASLGGHVVFKAANNAVKAGDTGVMIGAGGMQNLYIVTNAIPARSDDSQERFLTITVDTTAEEPSVSVDSWSYSAEDEGFISETVNGTE